MARSSRSCCQWAHLTKHIIASHKVRWLTDQILYGTTLSHDKNLIDGAHASHTCYVLYSIHCVCTRCMVLYYTRRPKNVPTGIVKLKHTSTLWPCTQPQCTVL